MTAVTTRAKGADNKSGAALGRTLDVIGTIIIVAAIILFLFLSVPKLFGVSSYTVLTGSMEPTIPVGSLVMAKSIDPLALQAGDVVVFHDDVSVVPITHRVISNNYDAGTIITQGDANPAPDASPILYRNIIGKVILHIPAAGASLAQLNSLRGKLCLISIILGALLLCLAGRRLTRR